LDCAFMRPRSQWRDRWRIWRYGQFSGVSRLSRHERNDDPDGLGDYNHFQFGSIYWTPTTGAHEVHGAIRDKWSSLSWERTALGYPVSDETDEVDGSGRFNLFQHGSIHWARSSGAVTVNTDPTTLLGPQLGGTDQPGGDVSNFNLTAANPGPKQVVVT
jgi:uncharacterized protein with LGFP repeats